jgi:DNA polymerase III alpha subunit
MISYRTSWLKSHYPTELMAALLTSDSDNTEKISQEMSDCEDMGLLVLPPSINESELGFSVEAEGRIRFGLRAVKGLGEGAINQIIESRQKFGKFTSLADLATRLPAKIVNKKTIECLAYSGALDELGDRRTIAENYEKITEFARNIEKSQSSNQDQSDLFELFQEGDSPNIGQNLNLKPLAPLSVMEKLKKEKDYLGVYVSSTPLKGLSRYLRSKVRFIGDFTDKDLNKTHKVAGLLVSIRTIITKSGSAMAYAQLEDLTNTITLVIFPKVYEQLKFKIKEDQIFIVEGRLEQRRDLQLSVYEMKGMSLDTMIKNAQSSGLYDPQEKVKKKSPHITVETSQSAPASDGKTYAHLKSAENLVTLKIPPRFKPQKFTELKELLSTMSGPVPVEIVIKEGTADKTLKTGLSISNSGENLSKLEKFLG